MMKKTFLVLLTSIAFVQLQAQNSGLYGHKIYLELNGMGSWPVVGQLGQGIMYDESLNAKKDNFNYGFNIGAGYAVRHNLMLGLETGCYYFNVAGPKSIYAYDYWGFYNQVDMRHEMLDVQLFTFIPTITFGGKKGLLPIGINHQVGIGYSNAKVKKKDYKYGPEYYSVPQETLDNMNKENDGFIDYRNYKGFIMAYTLKTRIPISKSLMINYGLRYTMNITSSNTNNPKDFKMHSGELYREIRAASFRSFLTLNLGVTVAF